MTETNSRTFYVESNPSEASLTIAELHANLWVEKSTTVWVDIGMMLQLSAEAFKHIDEIRLSCVVQVPSRPGSLRSLDEIIVNDNVARWLFNDSTEIRTLARVGQSPSAKIITYRKTALYVVPGQDAIYVADKERVEITLPLAAIAGRDSPTCDDQGRVYIYTRFRYQAERNASGYQITSGALRDHVFLDLRFNDARGMPAAVISRKTYLPISIVRIFLVHHFDCAVQIAPKAQWKEYERLLERNGAELDGYFRSSSSWRRKALIHQWKLTADHPGAGFNSLIVLNAEKLLRDKLVALFLVAIYGYLILRFGYSDGREMSKAIMDGLVAFAIAAALGLVVDFLVRITKNE